jgi:hypothetical protein
MNRKADRKYVIQALLRKAQCLTIKRRLHRFVKIHDRENRPFRSFKPSNGSFTTTKQAKRPIDNTLDKAITMSI